MSFKTIELISQRSTKIGDVNVTFTVGRIRKPRKCEECGINPADTPSRLCVGCDAYREHTGAF